MPNGDTQFDPIGEARKRYKGLANATDDYILSQLSSPDKFRAVFPEYNKIDDATIRHNMGRYLSHEAQPPTLTGALPPPPTPRTVAKAVTGALPAAGMTVGGMTGGVPGAALGGGAGEAARQLVARPLGLPDVPKTSKEAALGIAKEAGVGAATELGGRLIGKGLGRLGEALAPTRFASGETVKLTPGVKAGSVGSMERIAQQMLMGYPLRAARRTEQAELQSILQNIAARTAERAGAETGGIASEETWRAFWNAGGALRDTADPLYNTVKEAMRSPEAAVPTMEELVRFSRNQQLQHMVLSVQSAQATTDIAPSALKADIDKLGSLEPLIKMGVKPEELLGKFVETFGGGDVSVFDIFRRMRSNLLEMTRGGRLSASDARIASGLAERLTTSTEGALRKTMGDDGVTMLRRADSLWSQGRSLEELSAQVQKATVGLRESAQMPGGAKVPQTFGAAGLEKRIAKAMTERYRGDRPLLERAVTDPVDRQTFTQVTSALARSIRAEGGSFAARWHGLGLLAELGSVATLGHYGSPMIAASPELGAYIVSKALTSKTGARLLESYLRHPVGTQQGIATGARLVRWALDIPAAPQPDRKIEVTGLPAVPKPRSQ